MCSSGTQQTETLFIHFSSALFTDGKHRNCLNFTPVTLKYFLSLLIFLCLQPPIPPFSFLSRLLCISVTWLRANCVIFTRGRASRACGRASGGGGGVDFQVFSEHLPPTSPICRHLPRFSLHFLLQSHTHTHSAHACTHTHKYTQTHIL